MELPLYASLYEAEEHPRYIDFLTSGIASIVMTMSDGSTTEVATVGREGAPQGVNALGPAKLSTRCFMQVPGSSLRMDWDVYCDLFVKHESVRKPMMAYAQYQSVMLGQVAGCNRLHEVTPRLARWLLMVQDRTANTTLHLTQEFLGEMMGTRRTTVTEVVGNLQGRGLVHNKRGVVTVLDRKGLEDAACECYPITRRLLQALYSVAGEEVCCAEEL